MPHVVIEASSNLSASFDFQDLVDAVHTAALSHPIPERDALRTRAAVRDQFRIADGDRRFAFVAISVRLGPGRPLDLQESFMTLLLDTAEDFVAERAGGFAVTYSVEIAEIDPARRINRNGVRASRQRPLGGSEPEENP